MSACDWIGMKMCHVYVIGWTWKNVCDCETDRGRTRGQFPDRTGFARFMRDPHECESLYANPEA